MPIPKCIHFFWGQGVDEIPSKYHTYIDSWKFHNKDWTIRIWSDELFRNEPNIKEWHPQMYKRYLRMNHPAFQKDIMSLYILDRYGGFMLDMDCVCLQPIQNCVELETANVLTSQLVCASKISNVFFKSTRDLYCIASPKGHPLWAAICTYICREAPDYQNTVLPFSKDKFFLSTVADKMPSNVSFFANETSCVRFKTHITNATFCLHECHGSWLNSNQIYPNIVSCIRDNSNLDIYALVLFMVIIASITIKLYSRRRNNSGIRSIIKN